MKMFAAINKVVPRVGTTTSFLECNLSQSSIHECSKNCFSDVELYMA
jgi:hypothetical protein